jgi:hydroxymethylglutaryl-CoA lyase
MGWSRCTRKPTRGHLREVVLRDGLQQEKILAPLESKVALIEGLIAAGVRDLEITSFVHAAKVPAMADAEALIREVPREPGVRLSALIFNGKGLNRAMKAGVEEVAVFVSASEAHSRRNMGKGTREALDEAIALISRAKEIGIRVRAGVSNTFGCTLEGAIPVPRVLDMVEMLVQPGPDEIGLADTSGIANPQQLFEILPACREIVGEKVLSLHLHNASGWAFANILAALQMGVVNFDTALGGTGGCPFLPGAAGNLPTEQVNSFLNAMDIETDIDSQGLMQCALLLKEILGHHIS